jgi:hypothetical protein
MGRKAKSETERRKNQSKRDAYLTHGCGFADGKIFDFRSTEGFSSSRLEYSPISSGNSSCSGSFYGGVRCARSSVSFRSERRTAARATGQGRRLTSKGLATCFPLCVLGVAVRRLSHWLRWRIERSKIHLWKTAGCKGDDARAQVASQGWKNGIEKSVSNKKGWKSWLHCAHLWSLGNRALGALTLLPFPNIFFSEAIARIVRQSWARVLPAHASRTSGADEAAGVACPLHAAWSHGMTKRAAGHGGPDWQQP